MTAGPLLPSHRDGHCGYDPTLTGTICNAPANVHLWVGDQDDPDAFTAYACTEHTKAAHDKLDVLDWHTVETPCLTGGMWNFSGQPGNSFCFHPDDDPALALAALEEVAR